MATDPAVLIVGGGMLQVPLIEEALGLGLRVLLTDQNYRCPGRALATEFWPINTADVEAHQRLGTTLRGENPWGTLRGVVTAGSDSAPSVSAAAEGACVPGIPVAVAARTHNKCQVRCALDEAGLTCYSPTWCYIHHDDALGEVQRYIAVGPRYPCVVKPLSQRASRGVTLLTDHAKLEAALTTAWDFGERCLIESRLQGTEHSAELIFGNDGEVLWYNIVDRFFDYSSNIPLETGHINPTCLDEHAQQQILLMALAAAKALGVTWGPWKLDCMMTAEGPKILECTARLSGGWDAQWSSPATDRHPMKLLLQLACGLPLDAQPQMAGADGYGAVAAVIPRHFGTLKAIHLPQWAQEPARNRRLIMVAKPGDSMAPLEHNAQRSGYACYHAPTYRDAWNTAVAMAGVIANNMEMV